jgi:hypothetical protein
MSTVVTFQCPKCDAFLEISGNENLRHDCPEDFPPCECHDNVWRFHAHGIVDEDGFPQAEKPGYEMVFQRRGENTVKCVGHSMVSSWNGTVLSRCPCGQEIEEIAIE